MKRRLVVSIVVIVTLLLLVSYKTEAHAPYSATVRHAREWLRAQTSDGAFHCAHILWDRESHWNEDAGEPRNAYGVPQAYPGRKMRSAGDDWRTNATTQVRWGLRYVRARYGSFCRALRFQNLFNYY